ncbi:MAG: TIGR04086 family membrane protein [Lachnospiraceae bacterium]|nr:TIGR04086 family membrane protein [Lachnospiraceae bacterium]
MIEENKEKDSALKVCGDFLFALSISYGVTIVGIFLLAFLLLVFQLSVNTVQWLLIILYTVASFWGGCILGGRKKQKAGLQGMSLGAVYYGIFLMISFLQKSQQQWKEGVIGILFLTILAAGLGGITQSFRRN